MTDHASGAIENATDLLAVPVWRTKGTGVDAVGVLTIGAGRVRFVTTDADVAFDEAITDVSIKFPWYSMSTGIRVRTPGSKPRHYMFKPPRGYRGDPATTSRVLGNVAGLAAAGAMAAGLASDIGHGSKLRHLIKAALNETPT